MLRTFIAVPLPSSLSKKLAKWAGRLREAMPGVRWTEAEQMHLTLKFLGETSLDDVPQLARTLRELVEPAMPLVAHLSGLGAFPRTSAARILWIGCHEPSGELATLQQAVEMAIGKLGYPRENRPWQPHITLGRIRDRRPQQDIAELIEQHADWEAGSFAINEVVLYSSLLSNRGAEYKRLATLPLAAQNH